MTGFTSSNLVSERRDDSSAGEGLESEVVVSGVGQSVAAVAHATAFILDKSAEQELRAF
jgi:hypothetical protein